MPRPHILLVEDNLSDICILQLALKEAGVNLRVAVLRDAAEALDFLKRRGCTVPGLGGSRSHTSQADAIEIPEAIRSSAYMHHVEAVILTSLPWISVPVKIECLKSERNITKPSNLVEFLQNGVVLKEILFRGNTWDRTQK